MQKWSVSVFTVFLLLLALLFVSAGQGKADSDDDTLRHYLSKSEAVVVGEVTDGVQRIGVDFDPANPVSVVEFKLKVSDSLKGKIAAKQTITVTVTRALDIGQSVPEPGQRVVLFLKSSGESWASADKWFGMCPHSRTFVEHLKRVKSQEEAPAKAGRQVTPDQTLCCGAIVGSTGTPIEPSGLPSAAPDRGRLTGFARHQGFAGAPATDPDVRRTTIHNGGAS